MKRMFLAALFLFATTTFVVAQHGHAPAGGPPTSTPAGGAGMGNAGGASGPDMSRRPDSTPSGPNAPQPSQPDQAGKKTPGELLTQNSKLSDKMKTLLPEGTDLQAASDGFKNLGEFVAAVHVSHNLGISFDDLKGKMTGDNAESLGKAIQELKPEADSKAEAAKAKAQAKKDMAGK